MKWAVGFTGPRPDMLHGYSSQFIEEYNEIILYTSQIVSAFCKQGFTKFISGGAQGFDQLAFLAVNNCKSRGITVENVLYLPFPGQDAYWSDGLFGKQEFKAIIGMADEVKYITEEKPKQKYEVVTAMHNRNHAMVTDSDFMIALLAGRSLDFRNASGGTSECVRYALSHGKPVYTVQYHPNSSDKFRRELVLPEQ